MVSKLTKDISPTLKCHAAIRRGAGAGKSQGGVGSDWKKKELEGSWRCCGSFPRSLQLPESKLELSRLHPDPVPIGVVLVLGVPVGNHEVQMIENPADIEGTTVDVEGREAFDDRRARLHEHAVRKRRSVGAGDDLRVSRHRDLLL